VKLMAMGALPALIVVMLCIYLIRLATAHRRPRPVP
jgi:hypothetical protein